MLTDDLKEIISIKYKIIETEYNIKVRYLTSWWLFIPYWKPIDENTNSYECENVFGGKSNSYYTSEVIYKNNEEVISAINKHKTLIKNNRDNWFKYNKKEIKNIKYL
jgi:mannose-1-phosphate guanylyltransferase